MRSRSLVEVCHKLRCGNTEPKVATTVAKVSSSVS
jgi:hypothetical protein